MSGSQTFQLSLLEKSNQLHLLHSQLGIFQKVYTLFAGSAVCMRLKIQKNGYRLLRPINNSHQSALILIQKAQNLPSNEIKAPFSVINNFGHKISLSRINLAVFTINNMLLPKIQQASQLWIYSHPLSAVNDFVKEIINKQSFIVPVQRRQIYINLGWLKQKEFMKNYRSQILLKYRRLIAENEGGKFTNYIKLNIKAFTNFQQQSRYNYSIFIPNKTKLVLQKAQHYDLNEIVKIISLPKLHQNIYQLIPYSNLYKQIHGHIGDKPQKKMLLLRINQGLGISSFLHNYAQQNQYNFVKINCKYFASDKQLIAKIKNSDSHNSTIIYIKRIEWLLQVGNDKNDAQQKMKRILRSLQSAFFNLGDQSLTSHILIVSYAGNQIKLDMTKNCNLIKFEPTKQQKMETLRTVLKYYKQQFKVKLQEQNEVLNLAVNSLGWAVFSKILKKLLKISKARKNKQQKLKTQTILNQIGKIVSMEKVQNIKNVRWEDVGGLEDVKEQIIQTILLPIKWPEAFDEKIKPRTGLLFFGPPGTGKTMLGKCIANQCKMSFISVKGPQLLNMYIGESEKNVRDVFQRAAASKPCIVFMDELDALIPKRGHSSDSNQVMDRIVSELLTQMDRAPSNGIFVIGATNRPDLLDPSILRPGRFDKQIYLGITKDLKSRMQILKAQTRHLKLKQQFNYQLVLQSVPLNFTGADFYGLTSRSITRAAERFIQQFQRNPQVMKDKEVEITEQDFIQTSKTMKPSVSVQQIAHYEKLKEEYK